MSSRVVESSHLLAIASEVWTSSYLISRAEFFLCLIDGECYRIPVRVSLLGVLLDADDPCGRGCALLGEQRIPNPGGQGRSDREASS